MSHIGASGRSAIDLDNAHGRDLPTDADEAVWRALADPTRRRILDALRDGPQTTGSVCGAIPLSRFATMKHLGVLVGAGLVVVERTGRERWNHLNAAPLRPIYERWLHRYQGYWADAASGPRDEAEDPARSDRQEVE